MSYESEIEAYFKCKLPYTYKEFLKNYDQELKADTYIYLAEDVIERNKCYETKEYAPGYISIGNNGGGQALILPLSGNDPSVFIVDHGSMDPEDKVLLSTSFSSWIKSELNFEFK